MGCCESRESGPDDNGYSSQPQPASQPPMQSSAPYRKSHGSHGTFGSNFYVFLETDSHGDLFFKIGQHQDDMRFFATLRTGLTTDKMSIYGANADLTKPPIAEVESTSISGAKQKVIWADGSTDELHSSDLRTIEFHAAGEEYKWAPADKRDAGSALGHESGRAWKLVRKDEETAGEALAYFGESKGFHYTEGTARFAFTDTGAPRQLGKYWTDMASISMLKLWQFRTVKKLGGAMGDAGDAAGNVGV